MLFAGFCGFAQTTYTWTGADLTSPTDWNVAGNWTIPSTPGPGTEVPTDTPNDSLDTAIFPAGVDVTVNLPATPLAIGTLTANVAVTTNSTSTLTVNTVDGTGSLYVNTGDAVTINTSASVPLTFSGTTTLTTGVAANLNNVTVGATTGNLTLGSVVTAGAVTLQSGASLSTDTFTLTATTITAGTTDTDTVTIAGSFTTTGAQTYNGALTITGTSELSSGTANIQFSSTVGAGALTIGEASAVTFNGAVTSPITFTNSTTLSGTGTLSNITVAGGTLTLSNAVTAGTVTIDSGASLNTAGIDLTSGTLENNGTFTTTAGAISATSIAGATGVWSLAGTVTTTTGGQTYGEAVTVGAGGVELHAGANAITFGDTVGTGALTIGTADTVTFNGAVTSPVTFINSTTLSGTGTLSNITVAGGTLTLSNAVNAANISVGAGAALDTDNFSLTASGALTNNGTFTTTGGTIQAASIVGATGVWSLVGAVNTTAGSQTYGGVVTLGGTTNLTSASSITFEDDVLGAGNSLSLNSTAVSINSNFTVVALTFTNVATSVSFTPTAAQTITVPSNTFSTVTGTISINTVQGSTTHTLIFENGFNQSEESATVNLQGNITATAGPLIFAGTIAKTGDTTLTATGAGGYIQFGSNINTATGATLSISTSDLRFVSVDDQTITTSGVLDFAGSVTIDAGATTTFTNGFNQSAEGATVNLQGNITAATGPLVFAGTITKTGDITLTAIGTGGYIQFGSNINTATGATLSINTSDLRFVSVDNQTITTSGVFDFAGSVTIDAGATTTFTKGFNQTVTDAATDVVTLSGAITSTADNGFTFNGTTTLTGHTTITADGQNVTFGSTIVNGMSPGNANLTIKVGTDASGGTITHADGIGASTSSGGETVKPGLITLSAKAIVLKGEGVRTTGSHTYAGVVTLSPADPGDGGSGGVRFNSSGGDITFNNAVTSTNDSTFALLAAGTITLEGAVSNIGYLEAHSPIQLNGGAVSSTNYQKYNSTVTLGVENTLTSTSTTSYISFGSSVTNNTAIGAQTLNLDTGAYITFIGNVGEAGTPVTSLKAVNITDATTVNINANFYAGDLNFTGDGIPSNISFTPTTAQTINVPDDSFTTLTGTVTIAATDTNTTTFTNGFTQSSASPNTVSLSGTIIAATGGNLSFSGATTLAGDTTLVSGSMIALLGTVNATSSGGQSLTIHGDVGILTGATSPQPATTTVNFDNTIGTTRSLSSLSVNAGTINISSTSITTTGTQDYGTETGVGDGNVVVSENITLSATQNVSSATIAFKGTLQGNTSAGDTDTESLTVSNAYGLTFNGAISDIQDLTATSGAGGISFTDSTTATLTFTGNPAVNLAGDLKTTSASASAISFPSTVTLGANSTVTSNNGAVTFNGAITDSVDSSFAVDTGTANITFNNISGAQITSIAGAVTLTSSDTITFGNAAGDSTSFGSLTFAGTPAVNLAGTLATTLDGRVITFPAAVTLAQNSTVTSTNGAIEFNGDVTGASLDLTVAAGTETAIFSGSVGTVANPVDAVTVTASTTTFTGSLTSASLNITSSTINLNNGPDAQEATVSEAVTLATYTPPDTPAGTISFGNDENDSISFGSFDVTTGTLTLAGTISTTLVAGQVYNCNVILLAPTILQAGASGVVTFNGTVKSESGQNHSLSIHGDTSSDNAGAVTFSGAVGTATVTPTDKLSTLTVQSSGITINGGAVYTTGAQTYNAPLSIDTNDATLNSSASVAITFGQAVALNQNLIVETDNTVTFTGAVSGTNDLTVSNSTSLSFGSTIGASGTNVGDIDVTATTSTTFTGAVYATSLQIDSPAINVNGSTVSTANNQTYGTALGGTGNVVLGENTSFTAGNTATIGFKGTIEGDGDADTESLTVTGAATATFGGAVSNVSTVTVTASTINVNGGSINSSAGQTYSGTTAININSTTASSAFTAATGDISFTGPIALNEETTITSIAQDILFTSTATTIRGNTTLNLDADRNITFTGAVGTSSVRLAEVDIRDALNVNFNASFFATALNFEPTTGANANLIFTSPTSPAVASQTIDVTTSQFANVTGIITITAPITTSGESLTFTNGFNQIPTGASDVTLSGAIIAANTGDLTFTGATTLNANTSLRADGDTVSLSNTINSGTSGNFSLTIPAAATATFSSAIGQSKPLSAVTVTATDINLNAGAITTTGAQSYTGATTFDDTTTIRARNGSTGANVTFTGTLNASSATQTLNVGTNAAKIGAFRVTGAAGGNIGTFNVYASTGISFENTLTLGGATILNTSGSNVNVTGNAVLSTDTVITATNGNVTFAATLNGSSTSEELTINSVQAAFTGAVGNNNPIYEFDINANNAVAFNNTLTMQNDGTLTVDSTSAGIYFADASVLGNTATLTATQGYVRFNSTLQATSFAFNTLAVELNGNVTVNNLAATAGDVYITNNCTFTATSGTATFPGNLFIVAGSGNPVNFTASPTVNVNNSFVLFSGNVTLGTSLSTTNDVVLFGTKYNGNYTGLPANITGLYRYRPISPAPERVGAQASITLPTQTPWGGVDIPREDGTGTVDFTTTAITITTITVGKNFYANGIDINGGTIDIPDNNVARESFAEAYNLEVTNTAVTSSGTFAWISAADCSGTGVSTDVSQTTGWRFERAVLRENDYAIAKNVDLSGTYTITDDIIRVEFRYADNSPAFIENSNNEISKAFSHLKTNTGGTYSNGFAFTGVFSNPEGTETTDGKGDISVFYLKVNQNGTTPTQRWNTDANGSSAGVTSGETRSTDRGRSGVAAVTRSTIPNVHIPIALTSVYEALRDKYKNRIATIAFDDTADRASPVLVEVFTGQEAHTTFANQKHYDAHNFIELRYSEPLIFPSPTAAGVPVDSSAENIQVSNSLGAITPQGVGLQIAGLVQIASGEVTSGVRPDYTPTSDASLIHALYRSFSLTGSGLATPTTQSHRMRISIAGFVDTSVTATIPDGTGADIDVPYYPGYIDNAQTPSGNVTTLQNLEIKDLLENSIEQSDYVPQVNNNISGLYNQWDTSPPAVAQIDRYSADRTDAEKEELELIAVPNDAGTAVERFEFHFHDNTVPHSGGQWKRSSGWNENGQTRLDTVGGINPNYSWSTVPPASNPISPSPNTSGGLRASSLIGATVAFTVNGESNPDMKTMYERHVINNFFFSQGTIDLANSGDSLYLSLLPDSNNLDPILDFDIIYDDTKGFITDLAGNRLKSTVLRTSNQVEPTVTLTITPFIENGEQQMYMYFNKELALFSIPGSDNATIDTVQNEFNFYSGTDDALITDLSATKAEIDFSTERATGLVLTLNRALTGEELINLYSKPNKSANSSITGTNGKAIDEKTPFPVTNFGVNLVTPVFVQTDYGYDDTDDAVGQATIRAYDGSEGVHSDREILIQARVNTDALLPSDETPLKVHIDANEQAVSDSNDFTEQTEKEITFWMPTYTEPYLVFSQTVNEKAVDFTSDTTGEAPPPLYNIHIPLESPVRSSGDTLQFMFELGKIRTQSDNVLSAVPNTPLYHIYLPDLTDLTDLNLYTFHILNFPQRGGTTILNNVINTNIDEEVSLEVIMPESGNISVTVLTLDGNVVKVLGHGRKSAGNHYFKWDGRNNNGRPVARGLYWIRVSGPGIDETRKVMVVRD